MSDLIKTEFFRSTKANKLFKIVCTNEELFEVKNLDIDNTNFHFEGGFVIYVFLQSGNDIAISSAPSWDEALFTIQQCSRSINLQTESLERYIPEIWHKAKEIDTMDLIRINPNWEGTKIRKKIIKNGRVIIQP